VLWRQKGLDLSCNFTAQAPSNNIDSVILKSKIANNDITCNDENSKRRKMTELKKAKKTDTIEIIKK
jgi:hypothetical protein